MTTSQKYGLQDAIAVNRNLALLWNMYDAISQNGIDRATLYYLTQCKVGEITTLPAMESMVSDRYDPNSPEVAAALEGLGDSIANMAKRIGKGFQWLFNNTKYRHEELLKMQQIVQTKIFSPDVARTIQAHMIPKDRLKKYAAAAMEALDASSKATAAALPNPTDMKAVLDYVNQTNKIFASKPNLSTLYSPELKEQVHNFLTPNTNIQRYTIDLQGGLSGEVDIYDTKTDVFSAGYTSGRDVEGILNNLVDYTKQYGTIKRVWDGTEKIWAFKKFLFRGYITATAATVVGGVVGGTVGAAIGGAGSAAAALGTAAGGEAAMTAAMVWHGLSGTNEEDRKERTFLQMLFCIERLVTQRAAIAYMALSIGEDVNRNGYHTIKHAIKAYR